jgi:hypothetical protein
VAPRSQSRKQVPRGDQTPESLGPTTKPLDPIAAEALAHLTRSGTPELNELVKKVSELVREGYAEHADAPPAIFLTQRMQINMRHVDFLIRLATAAEKAGDLKRACEIWDDTSDPSSLWNFLGNPEAYIGQLNPKVIKQVFDTIVRYAEEVYHSRVPDILRYIADLARELGVPFEGLDSFQSRVLEAASAAKMVTEARIATAHETTDRTEQEPAPKHPSEVTASQAEIEAVLHMDSVLFRRYQRFRERLDSYQPPAGGIKTETQYDAAVALVSAYQSLRQRQIELKLPPQPRTSIIAEADSARKAFPGGKTIGTRSRPAKKTATLG